MPSGKDMVIKLIANAMKGKRIRRQSPWRAQESSELMDHH